MKKQLKQLKLKRSVITNSSKKLKYNEIRYQYTQGTEMANLGKGTKCIKLLLSKASKNMYEPQIPMFSPYFARVSAAQNFSIPPLFGRKM